MKKQYNNNISLKGDNSIEFLSEDEHKKLWEKIRVYKPTDLIELDKSSVDSLIELIPKDKSDGSIPSDILFLDTIPLPDIMVKYKVFNNYENFRVVIYPDYKQRINNSDDNIPVNVGAMIINIGSSKIFREIKVLKGFDYIVTSNKIGFHKLSIDIINKLSDDDINILFKLFSQNLTIWYSIQIALLNPIIKETFVKNTTTRVLEEEYCNTNTKKGKRKKVKYIKRHVINTDDINRRHNTHYERKTLSWYVIGHWRTYKKTGKKIFIKPYWKGVLRDSKKYNDLDIREREIVISDK